MKVPPQGPDQESETGFRPAPALMEAAGDADGVHDPWARGGVEEGDDDEGDDDGDLVPHPG